MLGLGLKCVENVWKEERRVGRGCTGSRRHLRGHKRGVYILMDGSVCVTLQARAVAAQVAMMSVRVVP